MSQSDYPVRQQESAYAAFAAFFRWYRPYLVGIRRLVGWTITGTLVFLVCVAITPLLVEWILHHGEWDSRAVVGLLAIVGLQLVVSYYAEIGAHRVANESAVRLRLHIFDRALMSRISRQHVLNRSSIVDRHTNHVDDIAEAVENTLAKGVPGLIRVIQSLILLTVIEPIAGVTMAVATVVFLLLHRRIGRTLLLIDHQRADAKTSVATLVDESISTSRLLSGLNLGNWQRRRFAQRVERLEHRSHEQGKQVAKLIVGAHTTGLIGLVIVTLGAVALGGESLAAVAAAILYVESVVVGLEALPPWVRALQQGVVSQQRIDMILNEPNRVDEPVGSAQAADSVGLAAHSVSLRLDNAGELKDIALAIPRGAVLGVVSSPSSLADSLVTALAGDQNPESGSITLDGVDVRSSALRGQIAFVPDEASGFDVSVLDELQAADPHLTAERARELLDRLGLGHLANLPEGLDTTLGPGGHLISVSDRQSLNLAIAVASRPRALIMGSLIALGDADTALPLVSALRDRLYEATVLTVRDPQVAEAVDLIAFVDQDTVRTGTHQELLLSCPQYARMWEQRLVGADVDLSILGLSADDQTDLYTRLVTESYAAGDPIYREGGPADRILFLISGQAAVTVIDGEGHERRTAVIGPGNHCGDLRLTVGETRAESVWALTPLVVRSLSREAITAGITGLLDRTPTERRMVTSILRSGSGTVEELRLRLPDIDSRLFDSSLALLLKDGAVSELDGVLSAVQKRQTKTGAAALFDRLSDL
ncbi:cyclic nucleotide-binding domain-containing protein [Candidatus Nanopelagicales bacterium]|nr:cyclic nucleotide-binding domain-containing protein [Candidatus Nanopelagicales bacterium]